MTLQFIHDHRGNTTGVYIPIEEWQSLKTKYTDLQNEEVQNVTEFTNWQKEIINERLNDYYHAKIDDEDFDNTLNDIEKNL